MNSAPGWVAELHYADDEQVQLDLAAIISRGTRLRRRRRLVKLAAIAAVCAIVPGAVLLGRSDPTPEMRNATGSAGAHAAKARGIPNPVLGQAIPSSLPAFGRADFRFSGALNGFNVGPLEARMQVTTRVPARFGRLVAIAGARARSGVWLAAAAARLTLIHVSADGALKSWQLPATSSLIRAGSSLGFAVSAGVAWLSVKSTLIRVDTKARPALVSSWHVPGARAPHRDAAMAQAILHDAATASRRAHGTAWAGGGASARYSLAVGPGGRVAVTRLDSSSVQLFDPYVGTFSQIRLPAVADQSLAVGFTRDGTLGIGYLGASHTSAVLMVKRSGAELTATVEQSSAIVAYGRSALLVGASRLDVVSARGKVRPVVLPARLKASDLDSAPPAPLPWGRFGVFSDAGILTFPAAAGSVVDATDGSLFWRLPRPGCATSRCPAGRPLLATDAAGNVWLVPTADQRIVELLSVR